MTDLLAELRGTRHGPEAVRAESPRQTDVPSIAVLPFANMSADPEQEYFCEGLAEELIDALARLEGLRVVGRTSSFQCRGKGHDLREVGKKLNVKTVLEGSVRKAGNRLRINAQLISADDGYHLWSERYDREMVDGFAVQDENARAVVDKLKVRLFADADAPFVTAPVSNVKAHNLFLEGRYCLYQYTLASLKKAVGCFRDAIASEPTYAAARAGLALAQTLRTTVSAARPNDVMPEAKASALKGLELDETLAEAHTAMAIVLHRYDWDWSGAETEYRRALELNPGDASTRFFHALLLVGQGQSDAAIAEARRAIDLDPLSLLHRHALSLVLYVAGRVDEAIAEARAGIELNQDYPQFYWNLGWSLPELGEYGEAVDALRQATSLAPGDPLPQSYLGWALGLAGHRAEARTILQDLDRRRETEYISGVLLASVSIGLGEYAQAIAWLEEAAEERAVFLIYLNTWPQFDPLRSDPRFQVPPSAHELPGRVSELTPSRATGAALALDRPPGHDSGRPAP